MNDMNFHSVAANRLDCNNMVHVYTTQYYTV